MYIDDSSQNNMHKNIIYQLDVRTKLAILLSLFIMTALLDSTASLYVLLLILLGLHWLDGCTRTRQQILMLLILLSIWSCMVSQGIFYVSEPRTAVINLIPSDFPVLGSYTGGISIYKEGIINGALQSIRISIVMCGGLLITWTSDTRKIINSMLSCNIPYEIVFMITTALRFFPVVVEELQHVINAQRLRGYSPIQSLWKLKTTLIQTLIPVLGKSLRRAKVLAISVESRGFAAQKHSSYRQLWPIGEKRAIMILAGLCLIVIILKVLYFVQHHGWYYLPALRYWYDFTQNWL